MRILPEFRVRRWALSAALAALSLPLTGYGVGQRHPASAAAALPASEVAP